MNLEQLRAAMKVALEQRLGAQEALDGIVTDVEQRDDKTLTVDETAQLTEHRDVIAAVDAEIDDLDQRVKEAEAAERGRKRADELRANMPNLITTPSAPVDETREQLARFVSGESRSFVAMPERRDMTTTTASATVATTVYDQIITAITEMSPVVGAATQLNTASGETMEFPTSTALDSAVVAEAAAIAESDPTAAVVSNTPVKYGRLIQFSSELLSDSAVDWVGWTSGQAGLAVGSAYGAAASAAVVSAATAGTTAGAVSEDKLIELYYGVANAYRTNGTWITNSATAASIRKLSGNDGGLWTAPLSAGQPGTLLGRPFVTDDTIATDGTILFGDFKRGVISRAAGGVRFERSDDYAFGNDLVTWRVLMRAAASLVDPAAIKKLTAA